MPQLQDEKLKALAAAHNAAEAKNEVKRWERLCAPNTLCTDGVDGVPDVLDSLRRIRENFEEQDQNQKPADTFLRYEVYTDYPYRPGRKLSLDRELLAVIERAHGKPLTPETMQRLEKDMKIDERRAELEELRNKKFSDGSDFLPPAEKAGVIEEIEELQKHKHMKLGELFSDEKATKLLTELRHARLERGENGVALTTYKGLSRLGNASVVAHHLNKEHLLIGINDPEIALTVDKNGTHVKGTEIIATRADLTATMANLDANTEDYNKIVFRPPEKASILSGSNYRITGAFADGTKVHLKKYESTEPTRITGYGGADYLVEKESPVRLRIEQSGKTRPALVSLPAGWIKDTEIKPDRIELAALKTDNEYKRHSNPMVTIVTGDEIQANAPKEIAQRVIDVDLELRGENGRSITLPLVRKGELNRAAFEKYLTPEELRQVNLPLTGPDDAQKDHQPADKLTRQQKADQVLLAKALPAIEKAVNKPLPLERQYDRER